MSDTFYDIVVFFGRHPFWANSAPLEVNAKVTDRPGAYLIAANHTSPYDIPLIMRHTRRRVDFVSIVEVFRNRFTAWFYGSMNAFPIDRSKPDSPTVRIILDRLSRGRVVCMFPEGRFRTGADSVVYSHKIRPGIGRIAKLANVPVIPCVIINSGAYSKFSSWLPLKRTKYAVLYGEPILPSEDAEAVERALVASLVELHERARQEFGMAIAS